MMQSCSWEEHYRQTQLIDNDKKVRKFENRFKISMIEDLFRI